MTTKAKAEQNLREACQLGDLKLVIKYCKYVNKPNYIYGLAHACNHGHLEVINYLISLGTNIHGVNELPLCWACHGNRLEVIKLLMSHGAQITDRTLEIVKEKRFETLYNYLTNQLLLQKIKQL
jgi:ankyrin repeat protein